MDRTPGPARWLADHPWPLLLLSVVLAAGLGAGCRQLEFDVGNESYFVDGDPTLTRYRRTQSLFGSAEVVYVLVDCAAPFEAPHYERLLELGRALRKLEFVSEVRSPLHARYCVSQDGTLLLQSVEEAGPQSSVELARERERVLDYTPFRGLLIDAGAQRVGYVLRLDGSERTPAYRARVADGIAAVLADGPWSSYAYGVVGTPISSTQFARILAEDMRQTLALGIAVALVFLLLLFKSIRAALGPLAVIVFTLIATFGLAGWLGLPLSTFSGFLITLVICLGVADAIHVVARYAERRGRLDATEALARALRDTWQPCLLASSTTAAGFLALLTSHLAPIRHLGALAAASAVLAIAFTFGLLPVFVIGWRPGPRSAEDVLGPSLDRLAQRMAARPARWALSCLVALGAVIAGTAWLHVDYDLIRNLPATSTLRRDVEFVDGRIGGSVSVQVVLETKAAEGAVSAEFLQRTAEFQAWLETADPLVRHVESLVDALAYAQEAISDEPGLPTTNAAVAQLMLIGIDDAVQEQLVTDGRETLRLVIRLKRSSSSHYAKILAKVQAELDARFQGHAEAYLTGGAILLKRMEDYVLETQIESFGLALLLISILVAIRAGEPRLALLSLVPNLLPVLGVLGLMGWLGIAVDLTNVLVATVAIGIVVDDTIHLVHGLRDKDYARAPVFAIRHTLTRAGRAVVFTSLILAGAFLAYTFSELGFVRVFGLLAGVTFLTALATDLVLFPALLFWWTPVSSRRVENPEFEALSSAPDPNAGDLESDGDAGVEPGSGLSPDQA